METTVSNKPHALAWIAGIAVTLFSALGIAAIMGWIPNSFSKHEEPVVAAKVEAHKPVARAHTSSGPAPAPAAAPKVKVASVEAPAPVGVYTPPVKVCAECGVVESVRTIDTKGKGSGIGAVGGAVLGGVAANQVSDRGTGKTVATVVGAAAGGLAGNEVEKYIKSDKSYEIVVRLENGTTQTFHEANAPTWQPGNRVKIVNGALQANT